jgi:hypothetical protein
MLLFYLFIYLFIYLFYYGEGGLFLARAFFTEEEGAVIWRTLAVFCCFEVAFFFPCTEKKDSAVTSYREGRDGSLSVFFP